MKYRLVRIRRGQSRAALSGASFAGAPDVCLGTRANAELSQCAAPHEADFAPGPVSPRGGAAPCPSAKAPVFSPVRDPENPYARFFTRGRSFAELVSSAAKRGPQK
jgi:hypothetical protein